MTRQVCCPPASACGHMFDAKGPTCRRRVGHRQQVVPPPLHTPAQQVAPPGHPKAPAGQAGQEVLQLGVGVGVGVGKLVGLVGPAGESEETALKQRMWPRDQGPVRQKSITTTPEPRLSGSNSGLHSSPAYPSVVKHRMCALAHLGLRGRKQSHSCQGRAVPSSLTCRW